MRDGGKLEKKIFCEFIQVSSNLYKLFKVMYSKMMPDFLILHPASLTSVFWSLKIAENYCYCSHSLIFFHSFSSFLIQILFTMYINRLRCPEFGFAQSGLLLNGNIEKKKRLEILMMKRKTVKKFNFLQFLCSALWFQATNLLVKQKNTMVFILSK